MELLYWQWRIFSFNYPNYELLRFYFFVNEAGNAFYNQVILEFSDIYVFCISI